MYLMREKSLISCFLERGKRSNYVIFFTIENKEWGIMADQKHIVIVGAGFGGVRLAKELANENVRVTLVDRHNYHLFQPLLYQVTTAVLSASEIA